MIGRRIEPDLGQAGWCGGLALALLALTIAISTGCMGTTPLPCPPVPAFAPWDMAPEPDQQDRSTALPARESPSRAPLPAADLADALIATYQQHLRAPHLPGDGCRLRPTCSAFGREALSRYHVLGWVWLADRLVIREHPGMHDGYVPVCVRGPTPDEGLHDPVP